MRVWGGAAILSLAVLGTGCTTLREQVDNMTYMPEAVRQNTNFVVAPGAINEANEWSWVPAVAGAVVAGLVAGPAFGIGSIGWAGPPQSNISPSSPRAAAKDADLGAVMVSVLESSRPAAKAVKPASVDPDRIELIPSVELFSLGGTNLYVKCAVRVQQFSAGRRTWLRDYWVNGGSLPKADAKRSMTREEFEQSAFVCLSDAMRGFTKHANGDIAKAFLDGDYVEGTVYYFEDFGQRALFVLDSDPNYVYWGGAQNPGHGGIVVVPLQHIGRFERRERGTPLR